MYKTRAATYIQYTYSDIGECLVGTHNCSQLCVELDGGFECDCSDGYELIDDEVTCEGDCTNLSSTCV